MSQEVKKAVLKFDTVVVGGGAAGIYTAMRLSEDSDASGNTAIIEATSRLGGRVLSIRDFEETDDEIVYEFGAMRFMNHNVIVRSVIDELRKDSMVRLSSPSHDYKISFFHLRGRRIRYEDAKPLLKNLSPVFSEVYLMDQGERGRDPASIFRTALCRACGQIVEDTKLAANDETTRPEESLIPTMQSMIDWLQEVNEQGPNKVWPVLTAEAAIGLRTTAWYRKMPLRSVGFSTLLQRETSTEAFRMIRGGIGYLSITSEWSAAEALVRFLNEASVKPKDSDEYFTLQSGMQSLLSAMTYRTARNFGQSSSDFAIHRSRQVIQIKSIDNGKSFELETTSTDAEQAASVIKTKKLFVCLPRGAIERISFVDFKDVRQPVGSNVDGKLDIKKFRTLLGSVVPRPLLKVICTFDDPWWQEDDTFDHSTADGQSMNSPGSKGRPKRVNSKVLTDTPLHQIYFSRPIVDGGKSNVMMMYVDGESARAWDVFNKNAPAFSSGSKKEYLNTLPTDAASETTSQTAKKVSMRLFEELKYLLARVFEIEESEIPEPTGALIASWTGDQYHAGWHSWQAGADSATTREWLAKPHNLDNATFAIAGEAYSTQQGWIEGAFRSAELGLVRNGWNSPTWLVDSRHLESRHCGCNNISDLLLY